MTRITVKAMKRALKKAGLKTTGKKAALTRRCKKAHLKMRGGIDEGRSDADVALGLDDPFSYVQSPDAGLSNKTPAAASAPAPAAAGPPSVERMGGRHRRGHRGSRKSRGTRRR